MTEKATICLVGPKRSGKTSLLATLTDCVVQGAHGYAPELHPTIQPITRAEFDALGAPSSKFEVLDGSIEEYLKLRRGFADGDAPGDLPLPVDYFFRLSINGEAPAEILEKSPSFLRVVDAGGDVAVPDDHATISLIDAARESFAADLLGAQAIVLVAPLLRDEDSNWAANLARLIERLAQAPNKRLRRVIVAFSQYERLFARLGPSAFTYACDPALALYVVRKHLLTSQWASALRSLESARSPASVRFTVFSSFGFAKTFQNPNVDPHQKGERRFRRASVTGPRAVNEFWRPFLTADPILYAALGFENAFMFSHAQIDGHAQSTPAARGQASSRTLSFAASEPGAPPEA